MKQALRRVTSPSTLTSEWSSRLEISFYLPQKTLNYMITIYRGPIDYVFLDISYFNNLDLYEHLKNKNLGATFTEISKHAKGSQEQTFFDHSRNQGANNPECEVALIMYNASSYPGFDVQCIHWTREVNQVLAILSSLVFNGNNEKQYTMVQGLAEALAMFPRPSNIMTTEEYYNGTRHCILVAAREPTPRRMPVSVPEFQGRTIGARVVTLNADFFEVAEMFGPLATSLSIISPVQHPIFEVIYNMGDNGSPLETTPIPNIRIGQFHVLLARNFTEAHVALRGKGIMDPPTVDIRDFANDNQGSLPLSLSETVNPLSLVVPNVSTSAVGMSTPPVFFSNAPTSTAREGSSKGLVQEERGKGVLAGSSQTCSMTTTFGVGMADPRVSPPADYAIFLHSGGNSFNAQPYFSPPMLPSVTTSRSSSSSIRRLRLPYHAAGIDYYGRPMLQPTVVPPAPTIPQFNPTDFWPLQPSATNSQDLVLAWEGTLIGKTHRQRKNIQRGTLNVSPFSAIKQAHRRVTSPPTLVNEWSSRLEIDFYLPQKALNYTITISRGPVDYVFFHMLHFNNLDLVLHLFKWVKYANASESEEKIKLQFKGAGLEFKIALKGEIKLLLVA
ncbi:unnamed protein product [Sphenostylis stenocarpa]|uniref:Mediator of RNA polymerase II transcription subunit 25 n=1 Tax=Sphenostylis stenocarpa TaxID=92480 RepID=A0AA86VYH7_9FABA|nr:unnamed protein product [Sphenostylis stenocarpa]